MSAAGLGIAVVTAYRKRFLAAVRLAAYSLVPVGLVMTGVVGWLADTALSPTAWVGFGVLGAAWLLLAGSRVVERRRGGAERKAAGRAGRDAVAPAASAPPPGRGGPPRGTPLLRTPGRRPGRGLQRHRGHPQEARHMTVT